MRLILSLFPGIGLLDMAFEELGFCVVRGPDTIWGGDIHRFHAPAGKFDGVIGGPPCPHWSRMANIARARGFTIAPDLIPEYVRVVNETQPDWFLMEQVEAAPIPHVDGYRVHAQLLNNRWLGEEQNRLRRFTFGTRDGRPLSIDTVALEPFEFEPAVMCSAGRVINVRLGGSGKEKSTYRTVRNRRSFADALKLQGLPSDFLAESPLTQTGKQTAIGNGVPLPMGRAVASAVARALSYNLGLAPASQLP